MLDYLRLVYPDSNEYASSGSESNESQPRSDTVRSHSDRSSPPSASESDDADALLASNRPEEHLDLLRRLAASIPTGRDLPPAAESAAASSRATPSPALESRSSTISSNQLDFPHPPYIYHYNAHAEPGEVRSPGFPSFAYLYARPSPKEPTSEEEVFNAWTNHEYEAPSLALPNRKRARESFSNEFDIDDAPRPKKGRRGSRSDFDSYPFNTKPQLVIVSGAEVLPVDISIDESITSYADASSASWLTFPIVAIDALNRKYIISNDSPSMPATVRLLNEPSEAHESAQHGSGVVVPTDNARTLHHLPRGSYVVGKSVEGFVFPEVVGSPEWWAVQECERLTRQECGPTHVRKRGRLVEHFAGCDHRRSDGIQTPLSILARAVLAGRA